MDGCVVVNRGVGGGGNWQHSILGRGGPNEFDSAGTPKRSGRIEFLGGPVLKAVGSALGQAAGRARQATGFRALDLLTGFDRHLVATFILGMSAMPFDVVELNRVLGDQLIQLLP